MDTGSILTGISASVVFAGKQDFRKRQDPRKDGTGPLSCSEELG